MNGVIWITGLSASGKSTIANEVLRQLRQQGYDNSILLDGDAIRAAIADPYTLYDRDSRLRNAYRICRMTQLLANQEQMVVVATISLFHEIHAWNRAHMPHYYEILVQSDEPLRKQRSPDGLYHSVEKASAEHSVVGVHIEPEFPLNPHRVIENKGGIEDIPRVVAKLLNGMGGGWE